MVGFTFRSRSFSPYFFPSSPPPKCTPVPRPAGRENGVSLPFGSVLHTTSSSCPPHLSVSFVNMEGEKYQHFKDFGFKKTHVHHFFF